MKKIFALFIVFVLLYPVCAIAADYGWENGAVVLGESGYKLLLPDHMIPVESYPNELATAVTPNYYPPDGMGIVVYASATDAWTWTQQEYETLLTSEDPTVNVSQIFSAETSPTALEDWMNSIGKGTVNDYLEQGVCTFENEVFPYILLINNIRGDMLLQAMFTFVVPGEKECYPVSLHRLYDPGKKVTLEQIDQYSDELNGWITKLLRTTSERKKYSIGRIYPLTTETLHSDSKYLGELYNEVVEAIAQNDYFGMGLDGQILFCVDSDSTAYMNPCVLVFSNEFASRTTGFSGDRDNTDEVIDYFWNKVLASFEQYQNMDYPMPIKNISSITSSNAEPVALYHHNNTHIDAIFFALQQENGQRMEDSVYMIVRFSAGGKTYLSLVTDQVKVETYLKQIGKSNTELLPSV